MKALLLSALTFLSVSASASQLVGDFPKVQFGSVFVSVEEVCVDGDMVKTQFAVPVCVKWGGGEASTCLKEVKKHLSTPVNFSKEVPMGEGSFQTVEMSIPLHYNIPFGYWTEAGIQPVYTEHYSIPGCEM